MKPTVTDDKRGLWRGDVTGSHDLRVRFLPSLLLKSSGLGSGSLGSEIARRASFESRWHAVNESEENLSDLDIYVAVGCVITAALSYLSSIQLEGKDANANAEVGRTSRNQRAVRDASSVYGSDEGETVISCPGHNQDSQRGDRRCCRR